MAIPIYWQASFKAKNDYYIIGVIIKIPRRNVELVRQVAGALLIIYVAVLIITSILAKDVLDKQTVNTIETTLDLPTAVALIAYALLSVKLALEKPKYRYLQKSRESINILLIAGGALLMLGVIYLKYFM